MDLPITLQVNGATHQLSIDTRTTLLDALREHLGLTGPKKGTRCSDRLSNTTPFNVATVLLGKSALPSVCCARSRLAGRVR